MSIEYGHEHVGVAVQVQEGATRQAVGPVKPPRAIAAFASSAWTIGADHYGAEQTPVLDIPFDDGVLPFLPGYESASRARGTSPPMSLSRIHACVGSPGIGGGRVST